MLSTFIDTDRYPIDDLDSQAGRDLVGRCRKMLSGHTLCLLEGFLREDAVAALTTELAELEGEAHKVNYPSTVYGWMNNAGFPPDHPRSRLEPRQCGVLSTDLFDSSGPSWELFRLDALREFVRRVLGYETLFRSECPTLAIQANVMGEGETFGWHYDTNDGVVSFTIQNADQGGEFQFVPFIRDENDENYPAVTALLDNRAEPVTAKAAPGTFSLFMGRRSIHRVSPVGKTRRSRLSLLLSYDRNPGMVFPESTCDRLTNDSGEPYLGAATVVS